jgi:hypothetical protein
MVEEMDIVVGRRYLTSRRSLELAVLADAGKVFCNGWT